VVEDVMRGIGRQAGPVARPRPRSRRCPPPKPAASARSAAHRGPHFGVFEDAKDACAAAQDAFEQLKEKGIAGRAKVVEIVKEMVTAKAVEWGKFEFEETKIGRLEHKIEKLQIVKLVPGVEWLKPYGSAATTASRWRSTRRSASSAPSCPSRIRCPRSAATSSTSSPPATRWSSIRIPAARARPHSRCAPTTRPSTPRSASRTWSARSRSRRWSRSTR
jgi:hypothetical protein